MTTQKGPGRSVRDEFGAEEVLVLELRAALLEVGRADHLGDRERVRLVLDRRAAALLPLQPVFRGVREGRARVSGG